MAFSARDGVRAMVLVALAGVASLNVGWSCPRVWRAAASTRLLKDDAVDEDAMLLSPPSPRERPFRHPYRRGRDEGAAVDEERVGELLEERWEAKKRREFVVADDIRTELEQMGVQVYDKSREWTVGRMLRKPPDTHDYVRHPDDDTDVDVAVVDQLLLDRLQAKLRHDFNKADEIKQRLRFDFGVRVDDGGKLWRGGVNPDVADVHKTETYTRVTDDDDRQVDEHEVERLIALRHQARRKKYWSRADEILDELIYLGIVIDDEARTWRSTQPVYTPIGDFDGLDTVAIERLVAMRRLCRLRRRYQEADDIRSDLALRFGIQVNDYQRTYSPMSSSMPQAKAE